MQSKLDTSFAKYHNDVQENTSLRNKNKGTPMSC
jgi:hypothetical protein